MTTGRQLSAEELEKGLGNIFESPKDEGTLELIVRRPDVDQRESVTEGRLDVRDGLVGMGKTLNLRGINAKVIRPGDIKVGDVARKV